MKKLGNLLFGNIHYKEDAKRILVLSLVVLAGGTVLIVIGTLALQGVLSNRNTSFPFFWTLIGIGIFGILVSLVFVIDCLRFLFLHRKRKLT